MAARPPETLNPASSWLSSQDAESIWSRIGQQAMLPPNGHSQQGLPPRASNSWAQSAEDAWVNIGKAPAAPSQLPAPSEYPETTNPFAIVKAGNDAWNHLSDSHPWSSQSRAAAKEGTREEKAEALTAGRAAWMLLKAGALEAGFLGLPKASKLQNDIMTAGEKAAAKLGSKIDLDIPSTELIAIEVNRIKKQYLDINPKFVGQKPKDSDLDQKIVEKAQQFVRTLEDGHLDAAPITAEELALAEQLVHLEHLGTSAEEIKIAFDAAILAAAGDVAEQSSANLLFKDYLQLKTGLDALASETEPKKFFIVDAVTSEIVLTQAEQKANETRVWGLTPTELIIRQISQGNDNIPIPLSLLSTNKKPVKDGYLMISGTPNALDVIRKKGGRLLNSAVYKFGQQFGGSVKFISAETGITIAEIVVLNPLGTIQILEDLADTIRSTKSIFLESKGKVAKQDSGRKSTYIRPNVVKREIARMEAPIKLVSAISKRQDLLNNLANLFNNEKSAGRATINNGILSFNDPRMKKIADKLAERLTNTIAEEQKYRANMNLPRLTAPN